MASTDPEPLHFRPIDLGRHAEVCIAHRRDTYVCSFGSDARFFADNGGDGSGYLAWLEKGLLKFPEGMVHAWRGDTIVGELEMTMRDDPPGMGYVNHVYLVPEARGSGLGQALHDYVIEVFRKRGALAIRLNASPTNHRANGYYQKHGWRRLGPQPGASQVHLWEIAL